MKILEKRMPLISGILALLASAVSLFKEIPFGLRSHLIFQIGIAVVILCLTVYTTLFLWKTLSQKHPSHRYSSLFFPVVPVIAIVSLFWSQESKEVPATSMVSAKVSNLPSSQPAVNNSVQADHSTKTHIVTGQGNTVGVNGDVTYHVTKVNKMPPSRRLKAQEVSTILSQIPSPNIRVRVICPANNAEAMAFGAQVFDTLYSLGYSNLTKGNYSESFQQPTKQRIAITKDNHPIPAINLIITPQFRP